MRCKRTEDEARAKENCFVYDNDTHLDQKSNSNVFFNVHFGVSVCYMYVLEVQMVWNLKRFLCVF